MPPRLKAKAGVATVPEAYSTAEMVDERRGSAHQRGYGDRWRKGRLGYLAKHPLCVAHLAGGKTEAATVVDHIVPHGGDMLLFWDSANWQALCKFCHDGIKKHLEHKWYAGLIDAEQLDLSKPSIHHRLHTPQGGIVF